MPEQEGEARAQPVRCPNHQACAADVEGAVPVVYAISQARLRWSVTRRPLNSQSQGFHSAVMPQASTYGGER